MFVFPGVRGNNDLLTSAADNSTAAALGDAAIARIRVSPTCVFVSLPVCARASCGFTASVVYFTPVAVNSLPFRSAFQPAPRLMNAGPGQFPVLSTDAHEDAAILSVDPCSPAG